METWINGVFSLIAMIKKGESISSNKRDNLGTFFEEMLLMFNVQIRLWESIEYKVIVI